MDEITDTLQRHAETYLHHTGSQWTFHLTLGGHQSLTKETFIRVLGQLRNHKPLKELAVKEYLEVRPAGEGNLVQDLYILQLNQPDTIQAYCINDAPGEEETGVQWLKRSIYAQDTLPAIYSVAQTSIVSEYLPMVPGDENVRFPTPEKMYRYVKAYEFQDKATGVVYRAEARKATMHPSRTMIEANMGILNEQYRLSVVWRADGIKKQTTKETYLELSRTLFRHSMRLMTWMNNEPTILTLSEQTAIMKDYGSLIRKSRFIPRGKEDDSERFFLAPKPITLERVHLIPPGKVYCITSVLEHYAITEKADGERMLLYINGEGQCFLINNMATPRTTGLKCTDRAYFHTLLDGEYVEKEKRYGTAETTAKDLFAVFDVYFVGGEQVSGEPLIAEKGVGAAAKSRNDWMKLVCQGNHWDTRGSLIEIKAKVHRTANTPEEMFKAAAALLKEAKQKKTLYPIDGLIFTPTRLPVLGYYPNTKVDFSYNMRWDRVLKWKPAEMNTIDFLVARGIRLPNPLRDGQAYREYTLMTGFNMDQMMELNIEKALRLLYDGSYRKQIRYGEGVYVANVFRPFTAFEDGVHRAWLPEDAQGNVRAENGEVIPDDAIVEFAFDRTDDRTISYRWRPLRVRDDKTRLYRRVDEYGNKTLSKTANDASTANSIWRSIHRPVSQAMIEGKVRVEESEAPGCVEDRLQADDDVYYAREIPRFHLLSRSMMNFHNLFIKSKLFAYPKIRHASLLELACGRGGDFKSWCSQRYGFVVGIDHSKDNILNPKEGIYARSIQALLRKEEDVALRKVDARFAFVPPVVYAVGDCSKPLSDGAAAMAREAPDSAELLAYLFHKKNVLRPRHPYNDIIPKLRGRAENGFDVVSCQFAIHYFFESRETLDGFFQNVSSHLKPGGYFITTFMDGERVDARLRGHSKAEGVVQDTVLWAILRNYREGDFGPNRPFGNRIRVYLENIHQLIPEYLVPFEFLIEFAATKGLQLVDSKTFVETFHEEKQKPQSRFNARILEEFEREHPALHEFSGFNRWAVFQKN
jgi:SAM-dependent methyltransferase